MLYEVITELPAVEVTDPAPRFLNKQLSRCHIPGLKFHFPVAVKAAGRSVGEVEAGGTGAPAGLGCLLKMEKMVVVVHLAALAVVRESYNFV